MKVVVIIPAYNEEKTIANVIGDAQGISDEVIVINDASFDRTKTIAKHFGATVYSHMINLGLGAALITGFKAAIQRGADVVVTMDADGQHRARDAQKLIKEIVAGRADVAIGSRLLYKNGDSMPFVRRVYNYIANGITYIVGGVWTTDSQSGLRAFSRYALEKIQLKSQRMEVSTEFFREIKRNNLRLVEVPIRAIYTTYSLSKGQSFITGIKTLFRLILNRLI
ncbi:glycosyltransferase family 2 protein [Patescibacteria group bacterium AH-259-L05]|nr:glycosyltransferase family 2 protein [Patescibacteria group bacterium AH-259-L05]